MRHGFDPWVGKILCRRKWQTTPIFFPGKSHRQRNLAGYSPWGHKESDTTECLSTHTHTHITEGESGQGRSLHTVEKPTKQKVAFTVFKGKKTQHNLRPLLPPYHPQSFELQLWYQKIAGSYIKSERTVRCYRKNFPQHFGGKFSDPAWSLLKHNEKTGVPELACTATKELVARILATVQTWFYHIIGDSAVKNLPAMHEMQVWSLGREDPLEKRMATHSSILAWEIPWTEKLGGLQSMGLQRVRYDLAIKQQQQTTTVWS